MNGMANGDHTARDDVELINLYETNWAFKIAYDIVNEVRQQVPTSAEIMEAHVLHHDLALALEWASDWILTKMRRTTNPTGCEIGSRWSALDPLRPETAPERANDVPRWAQEILLWACLEDLQRVVREPGIAE